MITLTTPESVAVRTRAKFIALGVNGDTGTAFVRMRLQADDGSDPRDVDFRIDSSNFNAFLQAASIDRLAVERFIAANFLPGTVA